ncbi:MAG: DUF6763 family protein [Pseudomonadota bacterium]
MAVLFPTVGRWYQRPGRESFEVVALDEQQGLVEIQYFDGMVAEIELEHWPRLLIQRVAAPEDWSGALDVAPEDAIRDHDGQLPHDWSDPLEVLERDHDHDADLIPH